MSTLVFVLTNKNLKIIKNRFSSNDDSININKLIRKYKLKKLEKI